LTSRTSFTNLSRNPTMNHFRDFTARRLIRRTFSEPAKSTK
jgi:hypothetical protein